MLGLIRGDDLLKRLRRVESPCQECGTQIVFEDGAALAWETLGTRDQVVMCKNCRSVYEVLIRPGAMQLTANVTSRYPGTQGKAVTSGA